MKIHFILCCFLGSVSLVKAQTLETISGTVTGEDDIENIHVINKTSKRFTITDAKGVFSIEAKIKDTIAFTAIQYTTTEVVVDATILLNKTIHVFLNEEINELSEVIVGNILTGNLMMDIGNTTVIPDINFYDVGIPGYMGKRKTQAERRLSEAKSGLLNTVVNGISGRTKILKVHVELERNDKFINEIRQRLSDDFFSEHDLVDSKRKDFFYFCSEAPEFKDRCEGKNDVEILDFLNEKYVQYIKNLNSE
ncbi:carboxypeptidase-like regulatory domain-containing protein [Formosa sp. PL04]|uniref:carboxypeptidase-like regulatory domain-containing protein n=1 Tax=Formosa sp. PL04 TaxID=3081755 RepID=UPI002980FCFE|nr:carboxypeptidase-like regulatory domain-containing protein [Formosa sp. PL04]MDW5290442.1 carboxypeptidase-like regulatory domain-containing protein [Formosa sp. PL04]